VPSGSTFVFVGAYDADADELERGLEEAAKQVS
jgi:hypothetical protein